MSDSSYVLAGFETIGTYWKNFCLRDLQGNSLSGKFKLFTGHTTDLSSLVFPVLLIDRLGGYFSNYLNQKLILPANKTLIYGKTPVNSSLIINCKLQFKE